MAETTQTAVAVDYMDLFADDNIPKYRKERENGGHGRLAVDNKEGNMVDLEAIGEVPDPGAPFVSVGNDDDLMAAVNKFLDC